MTTRASTTAGPEHQFAPGLQEQVADLLRRADIVDVRPSRVSAELVTDGPTTVASATFDSQMAYAFDQGRSRNRFTYEFRFEEQTGGTVATMDFVVVVEWKLDPDFTPVDQAAGHVAATTGYFAAFPYLRELVQSMIARLGLDPFVLGILERGELKPGSVSMVVRPGSTAGIDDGAGDDADT